MSPKKRQRYKVGDIVIKIFTTSPWVEERGIVIDIDTKSEWKAIYWFLSREVLEDAGAWYRFCEGMKSKNICINCEFIDLCRVLPDLAHCDISVFGEWRGVGEYDIDICKQRQCEHLVFCATDTLIQDED